MDLRYEEWLLVKSHLSVWCMGTGVSMFSDFYKLESVVKQCVFSGKMDYEDYRDIAYLCTPLAREVAHFYNLSIRGYLDNIKLNGSVNSDRLIFTIKNKKPISVCRRQVSDVS